MAGNRIKAALYARVSTEEQADKGYSLDAQVEDCLARAAELGYGRREVAIFTDDVSGTTADRPGLNGLRELLRGEEKPDAVIVYDPDRLARKLSLQLLLTDEWLKAGIKLEFVNFEWNNTPEGRLFYQLRGMFAEFEREKIRERTIRGRLSKLKTTGKLSWDPRLYGYRFDTGEDELKVDPVTSNIVKRIFLLAAGGASGEEIARRLAAEGIPAPRGDRWHGSTVTRILHNRSYLGEYRAYKTDYHQGYKRKRPSTEQFELRIEPLVDEALFLEAGQTLKRKRTRAGRPAKRKALLSGMGYCTCGRSMVVTGTTGRKNGYYVCSSRLKSSYPQAEDTNRCQTGYWSTLAADGAVWQWIRSYLLENGVHWQDSWGDVEPGSPGERADRTAQMDYYTGKLQEVELKKGRLLELYLNAHLEAGAYERKKTELDMEVERLKERLSDTVAEESGYLLQDGEDSTGEATTIEEWGAVLETLSWEQKQEIVGLLVERALFLEGRLLQLELRTYVCTGNSCVGEGHGGL